MLTPQQIQSLKAGMNPPSNNHTGTATSDWVDSLSKPDQPSLVSKLGDRVEQVVSEATLKPSRDLLNQVPEAQRNTEAGQKVALASVAKGFQAPLGVAAGLGGAVLDTVGAGLHATGIDKAVGAGVNLVDALGKNVMKGMGLDVSKVPTNEDVLNAYHNLHPEAQHVINNIIDASGLLGAEQVPNIAKSAVSVGDKALIGVTDATGKAISSVAPTSESIMQRVARIPKGEQIKFENLTGESVGSYLDKRGIYGTPDKIVEQLYNRFQSSKTEADNVMDSIQGTYRSTPVRTALSELEGKVHRTSSPGAPDPELARVTELANKERTTGLTMREINDVKRIYERRVRLDYVKSNVPEDVTRATNVDTALRNWQFKEAEKHVKNLQEINKETQATKKLMDALGKENAGVAGNNALGLTDAILVAGGSPESIASLLVKKGFSNKSVQSWVAKNLSPNEVKLGVPKAQFKEKLQLPAPKEGMPQSSNNVPIKMQPVTQSVLDKQMVSKFGKTYSQISDETKSLFDTFGNEQDPAKNIIKLDAKNKKVVTDFLNKQPNDLSIAVAQKEKDIKDMVEAMYQSGIEKYNSIIKYTEGGAKNSNGVLPEMGVATQKNSNGRYLNKNGVPYKFSKQGDTFIDELGFKDREEAQNFIDKFRNLIETRNSFKNAKKGKQ